MNIVFMGSAEFAVPSLTALARSGQKISLVITQPDKKRNRGMKIESTPVKTAALSLGLDIFQPADINSQESVEFLRGSRADLFVVIAYGQKLSGEILSLPAVMALNVHASLLPRYRGAAPVNWAVINGEKETGVTLMKMNSRMDAGPLLASKTLAIQPKDTAGSLLEVLSGYAAEILINGIASIESGSYELASQDENLVVLAPKLSKKNGLIDWSMRAESISNLIRGCVPWPGAYTYFNGKILKIHAAEVFVRGNTGSRPGTVVQADGDDLVIAAGDNCVRILSLQLEGKREICASEFISGHRITPGEILGSFSSPL